VSPRVQLYNKSFLRIIIRKNNVFEYGKVPSARQYLHAFIHAASCCGHRVLNNSATCPSHVGTGNPQQCYLSWLCSCYVQVSKMKQNAVFCLFYFIFLTSQNMYNQLAKLMAHDSNPLIEAFSVI